MGGLGTILTKFLQPAYNPITRCTAPGLRFVPVPPSGAGPVIDGAVGSVAAPGSPVGQPAARASWGRDTERRVHPRAVARSDRTRLAGLGSCSRGKA